jgi:hypothetical protein
MGQSEFRPNESCPAGDKEVFAALNSPRYIPLALVDQMAMTPQI